MLPYLVGGLVALDTVQFLYGAYQNYQRMQENERYWSDYYENTGIVPKYPYRAGSYNDYIGTALDVNQGVVSLYKKYRG